jgi:hypothetical protein
MRMETLRGMIHLVFHSDFSHRSTLVECPQAGLQQSGN